jgi:hypothetical protein
MAIEFKLLFKNWIFVKNGIYNKTLTRRNTLLNLTIITLLLTAFFMTKVYAKAST